MTSQLFPVFLKLSGRHVLVVGAGPVAHSKLAALLAAGANVTVVAPEVRPEIAELPVTVHRRAFVESDLDGAWFVVAAAPPEVNRAVARAADARHVFVNAVDDPPNASAYYGGIVRKSDVTIAISTAGRAPALAGLLREALEHILPDDLDAWLREADSARRVWLDNAVPMEERRPRLLDALNALYSERRHQQPAAAEAGR